MLKSEKILIKKLFYIALYLLLVIVVMCIPRIYAYLSDGDSVTNTAIIGGTNIEVIEDFKPPAELKPGVEFKKDISVKNNGYNACYVRVKAVFANGDMEKYCVVDWNTGNTGDWVYNNSDGYYYYPQPLQSGDTTPSLFTKVTIKDDTPASLIKDFDILVYAEGIQAIAGLSGYNETWANYHTNKPSVTIPVTQEDPEAQSLSEDPETEGTEGTDPGSTDPAEPTEPADPADPGSTDPAEPTEPTDPAESEPTPSE